MGECPKDLEKAEMLLERESSPECYLAKWLWGERTIEETDLLGHFYEWNLALEDAQCDVVNTTIYTKEETKILTQLERRNLWHYVPFTENKAYGYLEHYAALLLMTGWQN